MNKQFFEKKQRIIRRLKEASVPEEQCEIIADVMNTADLYGIKSHGSSILDSHLQRIRRNGYNLNPGFRLITETPSFAVIDGDNSIGFVSANYCMEYAIAKAKDVGIYMTFSRNNNTCGPAFYYPMKAAEQGFIGIISTNSPAQMPPSGGRDKMLGTNPFAAVIPVPGHDPIIIDMSTSVVAKSKFKQYKELGEYLPDGWALDNMGNPTNDPDEAIRGLVLPMAGYKGYCIAMLIDIISGLLSGAAYLNKVGRFYSEESSCMNVGFLCIAIDPLRVLGDEYSIVINDYVKTIRNSTVITGKQITLPGDHRIMKYKNNTTMSDE